MSATKIAVDEKPTDAESSPITSVILGPKDVAATKKYGSAEDIDIDIAKYQADRDNLQARPFWYYLLVGLTGALIGFFAVWLYYYYYLKLLPPWQPQVSVALLLGLIPPTALLAGRQARLASLQTALEILDVRKRNMTRPSVTSAEKANGVQGPSSEYFDRLVDINVNNLGDYYGLVRLHNDKSFSISVGAGVVGFVLIAAAIGLALFSNAGQKLPTAISAGSGVITEFIGAVFFYLYNRSVREMRDYFDSLLTVQNILLSLKLVNDTRDEKEKVKMVGMMLSYLVGRKTLEAKSLLSSLAEDKPEKPARDAAARAAATSG